jgi:murein DD-endopeptidase MepM/ murein hydrolase activator NlpD
VRTQQRDLRRHLPTIASIVMAAWLAAVCAYSGLATPASARRTGATRIVKTVLGTKGSRRAPGTRQRTMPVELQAASPVPVKPRPPKANDKPEPTREKKRKKARKPRVAPGHALPLPARVVATRELDDRHHDYPALDIAVRPGTKVRAVTPGRVKDTTGRGACGKGVIIKGKDGFIYTYCHGNKRFVSPGKRVDAGDPIMASGNTGNSTGPHLHLQISKPNGRLVCPQDLLPAWAKGKRKSPWKADARGCHNGRYGRRHRGKR